MPNPVFLRIRDLRKTYPGNPPVEALRGVNLEIYQGEIFGLLGPNGAGKTTLIRCLLGLIPPDDGVMEPGLPSSVGYQPQESLLYAALTPTEHLKIFGRLHDIPRTLLNRRIPQLIQDLGLESHARTQARKLSGGLKRRLSLLLALVHEPEFLVLDEPTSGMDPQSRHFVWDFLKRKRQAGLTVLLSTHLMEEAQRVCDRVAILDHGQLLDVDTPQNLIQRYGGPTLEDVFLSLTGRRLRD